MSIEGGLGRYVGFLGLDGLGRYVGYVGLDGLGRYVGFLGLVSLGRQVSTILFSRFSKFRITSNVLNQL
jgi:hypothetical protein